MKIKIKGTPQPDIHPTIRVTHIGEFINSHSCARRFKLDLGLREQRERLPFIGRLFNALDPVLRQLGQEREEQWADQLRAYGLSEIQVQDDSDLVEGDQGNSNWDIFSQSLARVNLGDEVFAREVSIEGKLGWFTVVGRIDFVLLKWIGDQPVLRIVECKSSRKDKTYHRIQVAAYKSILANLLRDKSVSVSGYLVAPGNIEAVVARVNEETNNIQDIMTLPPLDLEIEISDINYLLSETGVLREIYRTKLDALPYQLSSKCDSCVHNVDCLPESGLHRRLELVGLDPATGKVLRENGINSIDDLAELEQGSEAAANIRESSDFSDSVTRISALAQARISTLPKEEDVRLYQVTQYPDKWESRVPEHDGNIRIYISVDYDYSENRVGALSAHITNSKGHISTEFEKDDKGRLVPDPAIKERVYNDPNDDKAYELQEISGRDIVHIIPQKWSGNQATDIGSERTLIQTFFRDIVESINEIAGVEYASIHFYVWSRSEMRNLVEACSRSGSETLRHLSELLGCRAGLDQMIFSILGDEINARYAIGWTGRGLSVVTSLGWFGRRFHWTRTVSGRVVELDRAFEQNIFDFKTRLHYEGNKWMAPDTEDVRSHTFEIRSRFYDSLPVPYWHATWGTLPNVEEKRMQALINRFRRAESPGMLRAYLKARVQALRWIEERIVTKNPDIVKELVNVRELLNFELNVHGTAGAALEFMRLEQHIKSANWLSYSMTSPADRVPKGRTLPLQNVHTRDEENKIYAELCPEYVNISIESLYEKCSIAEGDFVRLAPANDDPERAQTFRQFTAIGRTCVVDSICWESRLVELSLIPSRGGSAYVFSSVPVELNESVFDYATLDESQSDFIASHVDRQLNSGQGAHVFEWFNPLRPQIPPAEPIADEIELQIANLLEQFEWDDDRKLAQDQQEAIMSGLCSRVQLLQGPPGTGKTMTVAVAILTRILANCQPGDTVLIACNTHTAVNNLLERVSSIRSQFLTHCQNSGLEFPPLNVAKIHTSRRDDSAHLAVPIQNLSADACTRDIDRLTKGSVLVLGGTTTAILKMNRQLRLSRRYADGLPIHSLVVDEASMMVFPHFIALATLTQVTSHILLAGDGRQLEPILGHEWDDEDRPPIVLYQPFVSAYEAANRISASETIEAAQCKKSGLRYTFRLPPTIRDLLRRFYLRDNIDLEGDIRERSVTDIDVDSPWNSIWEGETGLFLVVHNESASRRGNQQEANIIREIIESAGELGEGSVGVITPYRNQRTILKRILVDHGAAIDVIDTVEKLQGDERSIIFVSGTASDRSAIASNAEFILSLNRAIVAFSRTKDRLVVVCSEALLEAIPADIETYEDALLWKSLRAQCSRHVGETELNGFRVNIFTPPV